MYSSQSSGKRNQFQDNKNESNGETREPTNQSKVIEQNNNFNPGLNRLSTKLSMDTTYPEYLGGTCSTFAKTDQASLNLMNQIMSSQKLLRELNEKKSENLTKIAEEQ